MDRTESSRVHHEMERFYEKFPQYRIQANHRIFLDAAEQDGGSEQLTAEWMELQLDSLRGQLAVLQQTPDQELDKFMAENPAYDCVANRQIIAERIGQTYESVAQAVSALGNQLAFDQEVHGELTAQNEAAEHEMLAREISRVFSLNPQACEAEYHRLKKLPLDQLRQRYDEIQRRRELHGMTKTQLKHAAHAEAVERRASLNSSGLPAEITAQAIKQASSGQIFAWKQRYGNAALNARLSGTA